jgi:hypothetical protein
MNKLVTVSALVIISLSTIFGVADALQSTNFKFNETSLGGIGTANTASAGYKALTTGGIFGFGNTASGTMQVNTGSKTTDEPALAFAVATSGINFGTFSPTTTSTSTSTFAVSDYTSYGYVVQILGGPPTNGAHTIAAMATTGTSTAGVEQFGINLVANTSPSSFGLNPDHGQFGFGAATANYGTANNYRYVSGETIVSGPKSGGVTTYTISYIVNVDSLTTGGVYTGSQAILCTATF